jgi:hypothetical protein
MEFRRREDLQKPFPLLGWAFFIGAEPKRLSEPYF